MSAPKQPLSTISIKRAKQTINISKTLRRLLCIHSICVNFWCLKFPERKPCKLRHGHKVCNFNTINFSKFYEWQLSFRPWHFKSLTQMVLNMTANKRYTTQLSRGALIPCLLRRNKKRKLQNLRYYTTFLNTELNIATTSYYTITSRLSKSWINKKKKLKRWRMFLQHHLNPLYSKYDGALRCYGPGPSNLLTSQYMTSS